MTKCCARYCKNTGTHLFPKDDKRRKAWESALNRRNFKACQTSRLCSIHFRKDDFVGQRQSNNRNHEPLAIFLKKTAVPSIFSFSTPIATSAKYHQELVEKRCLIKKLTSSDESTTSSSLQARTSKAKATKLPHITKKIYMTGTSDVQVTRAPSNPECQVKEDPRKRPIIHEHVVNAPLRKNKRRTSLLDSLMAEAKRLNGETQPEVSYARSRTSPGRATISVKPVVRPLRVAGPPRVCRTCLTRQGDLQPLTLPVLGHLQDLLKIPVTTNDGLPEHICPACALKLEKFALFRNECLKSHYKMKDKITRQDVIYLERKSTYNGPPSKKQLSPRKSAKPLDITESTVKIKSEISNTYEVFTHNNLNYSANDSNTSVDKKAETLNDSNSSVDDNEADTSVDESDIETLDSDSNASVDNEPEILNGDSTTSVYNVADTSVDESEIVTLDSDSNASVDNKPEILNEDSTTSVYNVADPLRCVDSHASVDCKNEAASDDSDTSDKITESLKCHDLDMSDDYKNEDSLNVCDLSDVECHLIKNEVIKHEPL